MKINTYLNEFGADLTIEKKREIRLALQMNECQFDCETVREFLNKEQRTFSNLAAESDDGFQTYIRVKSRQRVEEQYKTLFEELIDA